jgi:hypothetical protein
MAPLPQPIPPTIRAIYAAYENDNEPRDGRSISVSTLADECARKLFYDFRWTTPHEHIQGRTLRLFETGNIEEQRWIDNLRRIGCEVVDRDEQGRQIMVEACDGHVRGYLDSEILGLPEAPKTIHVGEMKSHNLKSFTALKKLKVKAAKPEHYCQIQTYMYVRNRTRGIYLAVCKDNDELYVERMELDLPYVLRMLARAQGIINANEPPAKLHEDPNHKMAFKCGWCKHRGVCHEGEWPRRNCRTCLYSSPEAGGSWSCAKWHKPLSNDEQGVGCSSHLLLPGLVDGEQIDADEEAGTVTYKLRNGTIWIDGAANDNGKVEEAA